MCTARGVTVSSRDVTGGPGALAASSSGLGVTWPSSFRDSQEDKQVLQKQIVPLKEEATPKPGCARVPGVGVVGLCDLGLKMFRVCGPRAPFSLLSEGQSSQPAAAVSFATSWKSAGWTVRKPPLGCARPAKKQETLSRAIFFSGSS